MTACAHSRTKCEPLKFADGRERIVVRCLRPDCDQWLRSAEKPRAKAIDTIEKRKRKRAPVDKRPWAERGLVFRELDLDDEWTARGGVLHQVPGGLLILTNSPQSNSHGFRRRAYAWLERDAAAVEQLLQTTERRRLAPPPARLEGWD